jgi:hypothetical protein
MAGLPALAAGQVWVAAKGSTIVEISAAAGGASMFYVVTAATVSAPIAAFPLVQWMSEGAYIYDPTAPGSFRQISANEAVYRLMNVKVAQVDGVTVAKADDGQVIARAQTQVKESNMNPTPQPEQSPACQAWDRVSDLIKVRKRMGESQTDGIPMLRGPFYNWLNHVMETAKGMGMKITPWNMESFVDDLYQAGCNVKYGDYLTFEPPDKDPCQ